MILPNGQPIDVVKDTFLSINDDGTYKITLNGKSEYFIYRTQKSIFYLDLYQGSKKQTFTGAYDIAQIWGKINGRVYKNGDTTYSFTEESGKKYVVKNNEKFEIGVDYGYVWIDIVGHLLVNVKKDNEGLIIEVSNDKVKRIALCPDLENEPDNRIYYESTSIDSVWNLLNGWGFEMRDKAIIFEVDNGNKCVKIIKSILDKSTLDIDDNFSITTDNDGNTVLTKYNEPQTVLTLKKENGKITSVVYGSDTYVPSTISTDVWNTFKDNGYADFDKNNGFIHFYEREDKKYVNLNGNDEICIDGCAISTEDSSYKCKITIDSNRAISLNRGWAGSGFYLAFTNSEKTITYEEPYLYKIYDKLTGTFVNGEKTIVFSVGMGACVSFNDGEPLFLEEAFSIDSQGRYVISLFESNETLTVIEKNGEFIKIIYNDGNADVTYTLDGYIETPETPGTPETPVVEPQEEKKPEFPTETVTTSKEELKEGVSVTDVFKSADEKEEDTGVEIAIGGEGEKSGSIVFTPEAIAQIVKSIGSSDVKLKVEIEKDVSKIETSGKIDTETAKEVKLVVELDLGGVEFSDGAAEINLPFNEEVPEGYRVVIYYVDKDGNKTPLDTSFKDGIVTFETTHFSTYIALIEEESGLSVGALIGIIIGGVVLLLIVAYFALFFVWKKKGEVPKPFGFLVPTYQKIGGKSSKKED